MKKMQILKKSRIKKTVKKIFLLIWGFFTCANMSIFSTIKAKEKKKVGRMSRLLRIFAIFFGLMFVGNAFAAGYTCESYKQYTSCAAGYYMTNSKTDTTYNGTPKAGNACTICPVGSYCEGGTKNKTSCTAGKACTTTGLSAPNATCTEGYYCPTGSTSPTQNTCPSNYTSKAGAAANTDCYRTVTLSKNSGSGTVSFTDVVTGETVSATGTTSVTTHCYYNTACQFPTITDQTSGTSHGVTNGLYNASYKYCGGWATSSSVQCNACNTSQSTAPKITSTASSVTYYATRTGDNKTITLNQNGATTSGTTYVYSIYGCNVYLDSARTKAMSTSANPVTLPQRTGYTFDGYASSASSCTSSTTRYIDKNGYKTSSFSSTRTSALYACWVANCNIITLNNTARGGTGGTTEVYKYTDSTTYYSDSECTTGNEITTITKPTKTNAVYTDTYTTNASSGGTACVSSDGTLSTEDACNVTGPTTWYARYICNTYYTGSGSNIAGACTRNIYTISLKSHDSSTTYSTIYEKYATGFYSDSTATTALSKASVPTRSGYTFRGFYSAAQDDLTSSGGSGTRRIANDGTLPSNTTFFGNTSVYAAWAKNCTTPSNGTCSLTINSDGTATYTASCNTGYTVSGADTATPTCSANCNAITLNANGGTAGSVTTLYKKTGSGTWYTNSSCSTAYSTTTNVVPTRSGYTFRGFYSADLSDVTSDNSSGTQYITKGGASSTNGTNWTVNASATIYAAWAKNCTTPSNGSCSLSVSDAGAVDYTTSCSTGYTIGSNNTATPTCSANCNAITLNANGGTAGSVTTLYKKTGSGTWYTNSSCSTAYSTTTNVVPTRSGYTFRGFYSADLSDVTSDNSSGTQYITKGGASSTNGTNWTVNASATIYAAWAKNCTTPSNGSCSLSVSDAGAVDYTTSCSTGYTIGSNNTATPTCSANTFSISYAGNSNTGGSAPTSPTSCKYDSACTAPSNTYTRTNYVFTGWKCTGGTTACDGDIIAAGGSLKNVSTGSAITLTAQWSQCACTKGSNVSACSVTGVSSNACTYSYTCASGYKTSSTFTGSAGVGTNTSPSCTGNSITVDYNENGGSSVTNGSCTYGGSLTLPAAPSKTGCKFDGWKLSDGTVKSASTSVTCNNTNLGVYSGTSTAVAAQWTCMSVSAPAKSLTYNGTTTTNGTAQSCANVTVSAPSSGTTIRYSTSSGGTYSDTAPTLTNVGSTTVYYKVEASGYSAYTGNYTCTMGAKAMTVSASAKTLTYSGSAQSCANVSVSVPSSGASVTYSTSSNGTYSGTAPTLTNVGSTTVYYKVTGSNFTTKTGSYTCTMNQANGKTTIKDGSTDVTGKSGSTAYPGTKSLSITCAGGVTTATVSSATTSVATAAISSNTVTLTPKATGSSVITVNCPATTNYKASSATYTWTVSAGTITATVTNKSKTYDGSALTCSGVSNVVPSGATIKYGTSSGSYTLTSAPTVTNVADTKTIYYQITATNYTTKTGSFTCTISKATMSVSAGGNSKTYNGSALTCDGGTWSGVPSGSTTTYSTTNGSGYGSTKPTRTNAGTTTVYYQVTNANYNTFSGSFSCKVNKASNPITLSASSGSIAYPNSGTFTVSNAQGTLSVSSSATGVATASVGGTTVTMKSVKPGSATITVTAAGNDNYNSGSETYTLIVNKGTNPITLSASSGSINYNSTGTFTVNNAQGTVTATSGSTTVATVSLSGTTVTMTGKQAGTTTITVTAAGNDYYNSGSKTYSLTVNKIDGTTTLSPTSGTLTYPTTSGSFTATCSESAKPSKIALDSTTYASATLSDNTISTTWKAAGTTKITVTCPATTNYNTSSATYTLTTAKGTNTLTLSATSGTLSYTSSAKTKAFTVSKNTSGGALTVSSSATGVATAAISDMTVTMTYVKVGSATITVTSAETDKYKSATAKYTLTVNCAGGYYSNSGACTICDKGTYTAAANTASSCTTADSGYYVETTGATSQKSCSSLNAFYTASDSGRDANTDCYGSTTAGNWIKTTKSGQVTCDAGGYCPGSVKVYYNSTGGRTACSAGTYNASTGSSASSACVACALGSYSSGTGNTACTACQSGKTTSGAGKTSCDATCANNNDYDNAWATASWSANTMTNLCTISNCKAGSKYSSAAGTNYTASCTACSAGTYMSSSAHTNTTCTSASKGYYVSGTGATAQSSCTDATYQDATGQTSCKPCPGEYTANTSNNKTAASSCQISCAAGTRVAAKNENCTSPAGGWYSAATTTNYGSVSPVNYCMAGYTSTSTAASGHDAKSDCTRTLDGGTYMPSTTISARYVKVTTAGSTANTGSHVVEIQAFASADGTGTNLLSGKSGVSGSNMTAATDGSWARGSYASGTMVWDMGSAQSIGSIKFALYTDGRVYSDVTVSVSTDNSTWTTVLGPIDIATQSASTAVGELIVLSAAPASCAAGTYKASASVALGNTTSCSNCTGRTKYSAKGAASCSDVGTGYYTTGCNSSGNNCTGRTQCSGSTYCVSGVQNNCPTAETNWTLGTGTGWSAVTSCFETRDATNITDNCKAGQLKKNATSSATWPTSASISVAFQAQPGSIVDGQTCAQCTGATYSAGGTATTCTACDSNYQANTTAGKSAATQCQTSCGAGSAVLEKNAACAVVSGSKYKTGTALVNYGSTSPTASDKTSGWAADTIYSCPSSYSISGTAASNHDARTDCTISCAKGTQVASANATCTTPSGTTWYTAAHSVAAGSTSGSNVKSCKTGYATANTTTATDHDEAADCKIGCSAGYYIPTAGAGCKACSAGKYCSAVSSIAETATTSVTGNVTAGYYSTGGGTRATPTKAGDGCLSGYECGTIAAGYYGGAGATSSTGTGTVSGGYYSTGGGTSATPTSAGTGCLSSFKCGKLSAAYYSNGGSTADGATCVSGKTCGTCDSNYRANTATGKTAATQCQTSCSAGYAVLEANKACATIQNSTYKGKYTEQHKVAYGSKSDISTCPTYYQDGNGTTAQSNCVNSCAAGSRVSSANADCSAITSGNVYMLAHTVKYGETSAAATSCPSSYTISGTTQADHDQKSDCKIKCNAGYAVLSADATCSTIQNSTYKGKYIGENTVPAGSTSSISTCPTYYQDGNGTTAQSNCVNSCAAGTQVASANADCSTPDTTNWYTDAHSVTYGKTSANLSKVISCATANGYGNSGSATANHAGVTSCKVTCSAGKWVASSGAACTDVGDGYYSTASQTISQTKTGSRSQCSALDSSKTDGTYSSVSPRDANTTCRFKQNQQTVPTYCQTKTSNTMSYSGSAWPTNTYSVTAKAGSIISNNNTASATCSQCGGGKYSAGGTATSCSTIQANCYGGAGSSTECPNKCSDLAGGFYPNSAAGSDTASDCKTNSLSGKYVATEKATSATSCANWTYKGSHTVNYGSTSSCGACPSVPSAVSGVEWTKASGTGWTSYSNCVVSQKPANCASGSVKRTASSASAWGSTTLVETLKSNAGYYASTTATACTAAGDGYYAAAGATSATKCAQGSYSTKSSASSTCTACPKGRTTSGTGTAYNATANTACSVTCSNATGVSAWETPTWSANSVTNLCTVAASAGCSANYYKSSNSCLTCSSGTDSKYTLSAVGTTSVNSCYLKTDAGKYVATKGAGQTACISPYYCKGGTTVYYGTGTTTGGNSNCTDLGAIYAASDASASKDTQCYAMTTAGKRVETKAQSLTTCPKGYWCEGSKKVYYGSAGGSEQCPAGYDDGTTGYSKQSQCLMSVAGGKYVATAKESSASGTCAKGYVKAAHSVNYGSTSSCDACTGATYADQTGQASCTACPDATNLPSGVTVKNKGYWISSGIHTSRMGCSAYFNPIELEDGTLGSSYCYVDEDADSYGITGTSINGCYVRRENLTCDGGYYNKTFADSSSTTQMNSGKTLATAKDKACTPVESGYWSANDALTRTACETGLVTCGSGNCANEEDDCGRKLHAGSNVIYLRSDARTTPSLRVKVGDKTFYGALSTSLNGAMKVKNGSTEYSVVNDYQ